MARHARRGLAAACSTHLPTSGRLADLGVDRPMLPLGHSLYGRDSERSASGGTAMARAIRGGVRGWINGHARGPIGIQAVAAVGTLLGLVVVATGVSVPRSS